jgi:hypothetical protein
MQKGPIANPTGFFAALLGVSCHRRGRMPKFLDGICGDDAV